MRTASNASTGFSQGSAISLYAGLTSSLKLAGIAALSGYLPVRDITFSKMQNPNIPILMCHGTSDNVVPFRWGKMSFDTLKAKGVANASFKSYSGMAHSACDEEMRDVVEFIANRLSSS